MIAMAFHSNCSIVYDRRQIRRASIDHPIFVGRKKLRGIDVFHLRLDGHAGSRRHLTDRVFESFAIDRAHPILPGPASVRGQ
jgi:hypothetical protein